MADRVVLHLGTMKSGTTYLQSALVASRAELEAAGACYVGGKFGVQTRAVQTVVARSELQDPTGWNRLAQEARESEARTAVFSMEFLSFARRRHVNMLLRPLEGLEVDVVLTVRDQFRALPAQWQSYTRNTGTQAWSAYLREIEPLVTGEDSDSHALRTFRRAQDAGRILDRWQRHPGVASIRVVTVPPPGAEPVELWRRFARAARIDLAAPAPAELESNASLGYASCDLMRRVNAHLQDVPMVRYRRATRPLIDDVLAPLRGEEGRPGLDRRGGDLARELNHRVREAITRDGVELIGSVEDLPVGAPPADLPDQVAEPDPGEVLHAARAAWSYCFAESGRQAPADLDALVAELGRELAERAAGQE